MLSACAGTAWFQSLVSHFLEACKDPTICEAGTFVRQAATTSSDRICDECANGTFTNQQNAIVCTPWSSCYSKVRAGNATSDHLCANSPSTGGSHIIVSAVVAGGVLFALIVAVATMRRRWARLNRQTLFVMRDDTTQGVRTAMTIVANPIFGRHTAAADGLSGYAEREQGAAVNGYDSGAVYSVPEEEESRERRGTTWSRLNAIAKATSESVVEGPAADAIYESEEVEHGAREVRRGTAWSRPNAISDAKKRSNLSVIDEPGTGATYEEPELEHGGRRGTTWSRPTEPTENVYSLVTETLPGMYSDTTASTGVYATEFIQASPRGVDLHVANSDSDSYTPLQADRTVYNGACD